jgi:hypothetical protein
MTLSSATSIGWVGFAVACAATGWMWSRTDPVDAGSVDRHGLGPHCVAAAGKGTTGLDNAASAAYLGCQASLRSYAAKARWEAISRSSGR